MAKEHFLTGAGEGKGTGNNVSAGSGVVKVTDERGREVSAPKGTGVFVNDKELSHEELGALKEQNPALHEGITSGRQELVDRAKPSTGRARKADAARLAQADVRPIHTKEAGQIVNEMHKVLQAHVGAMRSSSNPRADKLADNPVAKEVHGKASQSLSEAYDLIKSGDEARRGRLDVTTNTVKPDQAYANKQYKAAFSKLKEAHGWANHPGLTQAGVPSSPISEDSMKAVSARFSHKDSLPTLNTRKSSKLVVVGNTAHFIGDGGEAAHDPKKVAKARAAGMDVKFLSESEARDRARELRAGVKAGLPAAGAQKFDRRITGKVYKKEVREGTRSPQIGFVPGQDPSKKTPKNRVIEGSPRIGARSLDNTPKFDATSESGETPKGTTFAPGMAKKPVGPSQPPVQGPANKKNR
jgi:hypothetical protein